MEENALHIYSANKEIITKIVLLYYCKLCTHTNEYTHSTQIPIFFLIITTIRGKMLVNEMHCSWYLLY